MIHAITNILDSGKKLYLQNSNILFDGNSLTFGVGSTGGQNMPTQVATILNNAGYNVTVNHIGVSGQQTPAMIADANTQIPPFLHGTKFNILVCNEIRNHRDLGNVTKEVAYDSWVNGYMPIVRSQGWFTCVWDELPSWSLTRATNETEYLQFNQDRLDNNLRLKQTSNSFCDLFIPVSENSQIGDLEDTWTSPSWVYADGRPTNNGIYTDGIHLTNAGYGILAQEIASALINRATDRL